MTAVDGKFDEHDIPMDIIWLDIEHTDGKAYWSWHENHFPTPHKALKLYKKYRILIISQE